MATSAENMTKSLTLGYDAKKTQNEPKDFTLDTNTLLQRANAGDLSAQFLVGMGYHKGHFGFPVSLVEANKWLAKAKIEDTEDPGVCAEGYCFEHSLAGAEKDIKRSLENYAGAHVNYLPAKYLFVSLKYTEEQETGVKNDKVRSQSLKILKECSEAGFDPATAFLGMRHLTDGWCVDVDHDKGLDLLKQAATQGDAPSMAFLGDVYKKGLHGVTVDVQEAKKWYRLARDQNYPGADISFNLCSPKRGGCIIV